MRVPRRTIPGVLAVLFLAGCGGGGSERSSEPVTVTGGAVEVEAHDIYFVPEEIRAPAGDLRVTLREEGVAAHSFVIDALDFKLAVTGGDEEDTGEVTLEPGTYEYYCDVPGHRAQGMVGSLVVG